MADLLKALWNLKYFLLLFFVVVAFLVLYVDPSFFVHATVEKPIVDNCGLMPSGLGIQHTIEDEAGCETQCYGRCTADNMELDSVDFLLDGRGNCHSCTCLCR